MPDKEGADDEKKSTKSVVNKKQKQMMGEEGYDIARDMGKVKPSKDKKDATTLPVSDEIKKTQKVNKGPSAFERVKAKYGKSVMKVEQLDLTKVAEAFGGYIVEEQKDKKNKPKIESDTFKYKKNKKSSDQEGQKFDSGAVGTTPSGSPDMAGTQKKFVQQRRQSLDPKVLSQEPVRISDKNFAKLMDRVTGRKTSTQQDAETGEKKKKGPEDYDRGKLLQSPEYYKKKRDQLISKRKEYEIDRQGKATDAGIEKFARTRKQSNLPLSQDDLDSAKKSMVGTGEKGTDVGKYGGKTGGKRGKDQPTFAQVKAGIDDENPVRTSPVSGKKIPDKRKPKLTTYVPPEKPKKEKEKTQTQTQTDGGNKVPPGKAKVTTSGGGESGGGNSITKLARKAAKNPALSFLTFDTIRKYLPSRSPFGVVGGRAGTRSAAR